MKLTSTDKAKIIAESTILLTNKLYYATMAEANNPYGNRNASGMIVLFFENK